MLNVALTFDYELFFGENYGTHDEIIFNPTNELLDLLDKYNVKATFFADVLSVYMHNKYGLTDYSEKFTNQIKDMVKRGHDVQLHIHSNWLKSEYKNGKWFFDQDSYRVHSFGFDNTAEFSVDKLVKWGKSYLCDTLKPINKNYDCIAYRAGGYCVQPHKELFSVLLDNGIFLDSSVAIGQFSNGTNSYDFKDITNRVAWWCDINGELKDRCAPSPTAVYELPIGGIKPSLFRRVFSPKKEKNLIQKSMRGSYIGSSTTKKAPTKKANIIIRILNYGKGLRMLTCDSANYALLIQGLNKAAMVNKNGDVSVIGHPKLIDDEWLKNFESLLIALKESKKCTTTTVLQIGNNAKLNKNI